MTTPPSPQIGTGGDQLVSSGGQRTALGISTATVVKGTAGRVCRATVVVAGSGAGTINDLASTSGASALNVVAVLPAATGTYQIDWPVENGILVMPGAGQTVAVAFL